MNSFSMSAKKSVVVLVCEGLGKVTVYAAAFLLPVWFGPWSADVLEGNKQALLVILAFIGLTAWILRVLITGFAPVRKSPLWVPLAIFLVGYIVATIFSLSGYASIFGSPQLQSESLLTVLALGIFGGLIVTTFSEREAMPLAIVAASSFTLALIYALLQYAQVHLLPFSFAHDQFTTLGSADAVGLVTSILMPFWMVMAFVAKRWWKLWAIAGLWVAFVVLLFIDAPAFWILALIGSLLVAAGWLMQRTVFDGRWLALPMFFCFVSVFFLITHDHIKFLPPVLSEVSLPQTVTLTVDQSAIWQHPLGLGPGTFVYGFLRYKPAAFNHNPLWSVAFTSGSSEFFTVLATAGVVACTAFLIFLIWLVALAVNRWSAAAKKEEKSLLSNFFITLQQRQMVLVLLSMVVVQTVGYFLVGANMATQFLYVIAIALLVLLVVEPREMIALKPSQLSTFFVVIWFTVIWLAGAGMVFLQIERYLADSYFHQALYAFNHGQKLEGIAAMKKAAQTNTYLDVYENQLALFSLSQLQDVVAKSSSQNSSQVQSLVSDSITAVNAAIGRDPQSVNNWSAKGYICQNLVSVISDALDCAVQSYDHAIAVSPTNPYLWVQKGVAYLAQAAGTQDQNKTQQLYSTASAAFSQAIALKKDYALAYVQKALLEQAQSNTSAALLDAASAERYARNDPELFFEIGIVYYKNAALDKAATEFNSVLALNPRHPNALYYLGLIYDQQNKSALALDAFSRLQQIYPQDATIAKIVDNIKNGKHALDGLVQSTPLPAPAVNSTGTKPKK